MSFGNFTDNIDIIFLGVRSLIQLMVIIIISRLCSHYQYVVIIIIRGISNTNDSRSSSAWSNPVIFAKLKNTKLKKLHKLSKQEFLTAVNFVNFTGIIDIIFLGVLSLW